MPHINQGYLVAEDNHIRQAQFAFGESVLTFADYRLRFVMAPRRVHSTTLPRTEQRLVGLQFPGYGIIVWDVENLNESIGSVGGYEKLYLKKLVQKEFARFKRRLDIPT